LGKAIVAMEDGTKLADSGGSINIDLAAQEVADLKQLAPALKAAAIAAGFRPAPAAIAAAAPAAA